jgi:hypothetical protein
LRHFHVTTHGRCRAACVGFEGQNQTNRQRLRMKQALKARVPFKRRMGSW